MYGRYKMIIFILVVVFATAYIFSNSLKSKEESKADSDVIVEIVEEIAEKIYPGNQWDWNYIVRKSAHLFEFCVLGIFTMLLFLHLKKERWKTVVYGFFYVFFIACADEFIQRFTGRGSAFTDVLIDITGASIGIGVVLSVTLLTKRIRRKIP